MTSRPSTAAPILAVLAIVLVMLGAYVGGYSWLGERHHWVDEERIERIYSQQWLVSIFKPASDIEAWLLGVEVELQGPDDLIPWEFVNPPLPTLPASSQQRDGVQASQWVPGREDHASLTLPREGMPTEKRPDAFWTSRRVVS